MSLKEGFAESSPKKSLARALGKAVGLACPSRRRHNTSSPPAVQGRLAVSRDQPQGPICSKAQTGVKCLTSLYLNLELAVSSTTQLVFLTCKRRQTRSPGPRLSGRSQARAAAPAGGRWGACRPGHRPLDPGPLSRLDASSRDNQARSAAPITNLGEEGSGARNSCPDTSCRRSGASAARPPPARTGPDAGAKARAGHPRDSRPVCPRRV